MTENINIAITGKQQDSDPVIVEAKGTYILDSSKEFATHTICYEEQDEDKLVICNKLVLTTTDLFLIKTGAVNSEMHFVVGQKTTTLYKLQGMTLDLIVKTKNFKVEIEEEYIRIELIYDLYLTEDDSIENELEIIIKPLQ